MNAQFPATLGVLLAGGLGRRMGGGDKPLRKLGGRTLLERATLRLAPQCDALILNANGDPSRFPDLGLPIVADDVPDFAGQLAGILAALDWAARHRPQIGWVVSVPTDCPFLPSDLVARLHEARARTGTPCACARSDGRDHPVLGLWPVALRDDLRHALVGEDLRKIAAWTARHGVSTAEWDTAPYDPFFNVNTTEDLAEAEVTLIRHPAA